MDMSIIIPTALTALLGVLGYFLRRQVTALDRLEQAFSREQRHTQEALTKIRDEYLKNEEFARFQNAIDYKLTKIYDLLVSQR